MWVQVAPNKDSLEPLETNSWQKELLPEPGKPQTLDFYKGQIYKEKPNVENKLFPDANVGK